MRAFSDAAARSLRRSDVLVHDASSEDFLVALMSSRRTGPNLGGRTGYRTILARVGVVFEETTGLVAQTGWTQVRGLESDGLELIVERALERGRLDGQRYAFFSAVGHELRTPLTSIRGYLGTVLTDKLDDATCRHFLEIAESEAGRLARLLDGMFEISLLDLRAASEPVASTFVSTAVAKALLAVEGRTRGRGISLHRCESVPEVILAIAEERLLQVLINVLINAIDHGRENGVVRLSVAMCAGNCDVFVEDDGEGVAPDERDLIFELGQRGRGARSNGTGIGLAVTRLILDRVGGEIDVDDSPLGGARFRIRLPLSDDLTARATSSHV